MNNRGSDGSSETAEKQYMVIASIVFAVIISLAAANFVKNQATKEAFTREIQSKELATLTDIAAFSPGTLKVTYQNNCCEFQIEDGNIKSKLPSDLVGKNYALLTPWEEINSKPTITHDVLLKKSAGGLEIDEQERRA